MDSRRVVVLIEDELGDLVGLFGEIEGSPLRMFLSVVVGLGSGAGVELGAGFESLVESSTSPATLFPQRTEVHSWVEPPADTQLLFHWLHSREGIVCAYSPRSGSVPLRHLQVYSRVFYDRGVC